MSQLQLRSTMPQADWSSEVKTDARGVMGLGGKVALAALAAFLVLGTIIPLDSAVQGTGTVIAKGRNKTVQHRVGGRVQKILVTEGQHVKKDDALYELETAVDQAQLSQLKARYAVMKAVKSRLQLEKSSDAVLRTESGAEVVGEVEVTNSTSDAVASPSDKELIAEQQREFQKGRAAIAAEIESLKERAAAQRRQQVGLKSREALLREQVTMLNRQAASLRRLVKGDHIPKQRLWDVESQLLDRKNELDRVSAEKEASTNAIAEIDSTIRSIRAKDERQTSEKLTEVIGNMDELRDQIIAAESTLKNTVIRAPIDGTIVHMTATTEGGVVAPGEAVAEIVPEGAAVELLARVRPEDIGFVHEGQQAEMMITALNRRIFDKVPGKVIYVAADATEDRRTGERYFEVRGELDLKHMDGRAHVTPGMNGQVFLKAQPRSFFSYVLQPITDGFSSAFKEPH